MFLQGLFRKLLQGIHAACFHSAAVFFHFGELDELHDLLFNGLRHDPVSFVIGFLLGPPPFRLFNGTLHGSSHDIGIHDDPAVGIAGGSANGLDHCSIAAQEPFLISIQDSHKGNFRHIKPFAQEVDAD